MNKKTYHYVQRCSFFNVCQHTGWKKGGPSSREGDFFITLRLCPSKKLDRVAKSGSKIFIVAHPFHPNPSWYYCLALYVQIYINIYYEERTGNISCTAFSHVKHLFCCQLRIPTFFAITKKCLLELLYYYLILSKNSCGCIFIYESLYIGLTYVTYFFCLFVSLQKLFLKGGFVWMFSFLCTIFSTASSAAPQIQCVGGCWDRTQDSCDYAIGCQKLNEKN